MLNALLIIFYLNALLLLPYMETSTIFTATDGVFKNKIKIVGQNESYIYCANELNRHCYLLLLYDSSH